MTAEPAFKSDFLRTLRDRGYIHQITHPAELDAAASEGIVTGYIGFDPTGRSLHVGSLLQMMSLARLQRAGHRPIALVGGGTGMIGDPSGKTKERQLQTREEVERNVAGIRGQLERFLDFTGDNAALLIDNHDWLGSLSLIEFMRDVGKHFTVNAMLAKESVKRRIEQEDGISFTEFSYMLLQAYDYLRLFDLHGCRLQLGGSDQWGNLTAGLDLSAPGGPDAPGGCVCWSAGQWVMRSTSPMPLMRGSGWKWGANIIARVGGSRIRPCWFAPPPRSAAVKRAMSRVVE